VDIENRRGKFMEITAINPETGAEFKTESKSITSEFIALMDDFEMTDEKIKRAIDNLDVSADPKALLYKFSKATIQAGEYVLKIGKKIIDCICSVFREFRHASFGMIFGSIAGILISIIPIIGWILGPIVTPILILLEMVGGLREDLKDKQLERKVAEITAKFTPLQSA